MSWTLPIGRARLREGPGLVVDDAPHGHVLAAPLLLPVQSGYALAGIRILDHAQPIPDQPADIEFIVQNAVAPLARSIDRRCVPARAAWRPNAVAIEGGSYRARRFSLGIEREDSSYCRGFDGVDREFTRFARHKIVSIRAAARALAFRDATSQATPDFVGQVLKVERTHKAPNADLYGVCPAVMDGANVDTLEFQALVQVRQIFLIAGKAIQRFDNDDVEGAVTCGVDELHQTFAAEYRRSRLGAISVDRRYLQSLTCRELPAQGDLIIDRSFVLQLAREAGVYNSLQVLLFVLLAHSAGSFLSRAFRSRS